MSGYPTFVSTHVLRTSHPVHRYHGELMRGLIPGSGCLTHTRCFDASQALGQAILDTIMMLCLFVLTTTEPRAFDFARRLAYPVERCLPVKHIWYQNTAR